MMIEDEWYPNAQTDMQDWNFGISLNNQVLTSINGLTKRICYSKNVEETTQQEHVLTLSLVGGGNIEHQMLKLKIEIEHVDVGVVLEQSGQYILNDGTVKAGGTYMGENGQQQLLFTTPIYQWLLDNRYSIINSYRANVIK